MPDDDHARELRARASAAMNEGLIPRERPKSLWGGHGSGENCPVCGQSIEAADMELEIEFDGNGAGGARALHMHLPCFAAWEIERKVAPG